MTSLQYKNAPDASKHILDSINDFHGEVKLGKYEAKFKISRRNLQLIDGLIELEQGKVLSII